MNEKDGTTGEEAPSEADAFFVALEHGDLAGAKTQLQQLKSLSKQDIARLTDFFDSDPKLAHFDEWKFELVRRRTGKPTRPKYQQRAVSLARGRRVEQLYRELGKLDAAVATAKDEFNVERSTLMKDRKLWKEGSKAKSPVK